MTDFTSARLAELRAVAEAAEPMTVFGGRAQTTFVSMEKSDVLALIAALEAKTAEVEGYKQSYPCDGGCSYGDGPQEECSRHGRNPRELWSIITTAERERDEALAQLGNGSCWDEGPRLRTPDCGEQPGPLCELIAGHAGAHRSGTSQWIRNEMSYTQMRIERDEARAEVDDLAADPGHKAAKYWKWWQREKARAGRAEAALERVKELHRPGPIVEVWGRSRSQSDDFQVCRECTDEDNNWAGWPCPTIQAIEGSDDA